MAGSGTTHLRDEETVLRVENLVVEFPASGGRTVHAVSDLSFDLVPGETLGLVGESGCGKSTTGRAIMQLPRPTSGKIDFEARNLMELSDAELRRLRPKLQMIFQDPISSLNPRRSIRDIVRDPLLVWGKKGTSEERIREVFDSVGLDADLVGDRRAHQFSGGQCQRISIARALVLDPNVLICDEPVSALDVSVQAQILNLLEELKAKYGLSMIFIAHDLAVVRNISDRVAVMYLGKMCEVAPSIPLYESPAHPYTVALLSAIPKVGTTSVAGGPRVEGELPSPMNPPSGCRFRTRCPRADARCAEVEPQMRELRPGHFVACHYPMEPGEVPVAMNGSAAAGE
ncbi:MAG: ABC transporter ATP-binding protein [Actinomycetota bacterium]